MNGSMRVRAASVLVAVACVAGLTACSTSTPSALSTPTTHAVPTTSPPPGPSDLVICKLVKTAAFAYAAKKVTAWRSDITLVAGLADSAQYLPLKKYAEEIKQAESEAATTTTTTKSKSKERVARVNTGPLFATVGGFLGLDHVCASMPT